MFISSDSNTKGALLEEELLTILVYPGFSGVGVDQSLVYCYGYTKHYFFGLFVFVVYCFCFLFSCLSLFLFLYIFFLLYFLLFDWLFSYLVFALFAFYDLRSLITLITRLVSSTWFFLHIHPTPINTISVRVDDPKF